jgi:hypothetical protein
MLPTLFLFLCFTKKTRAFISNQDSAQAGLFSLKVRESTAFAKIVISIDRSNIFLIIG